MTDLVSRANATPAQIVFAFVHVIGGYYLTGTSNAEHMKQGLASLDIPLPPDAAQEIEPFFG